MSDAPARLRILLVEDNPGDARLVGESLREAEDFHHELHHSPNLTDAVVTLQEQPVDIILLDLCIPEANGLETLRMVQVATPNIPIIVMTGMNDDATGIEAVRMGAQDYLIKGRDASILPRSIRYAVERHQTRQALHHSEERFRRLAENAPDIIFRYRLHPTPGFDYISPAIFKITGYTQEEFYSDPLLYHTLLQADEATAQQPGTLDRHAMLPSTVRCICKDGTVRWLEHRKVALFDDQGVPEAEEGIIRDMTDRMLLEDELQRSRKLAAIGQLAGGIAHDFNNLLTAILTFSDFLLKEIDDPDQRDDITEIKLAGERGALLTRQLLAFSRRQLMHPKVMDLNDILRGMQNMLQSLIGRDIQFDVRLSDDLWSILSDPGQIEQCILNLVLNARDAMPEGGTLTIETRNLLLNGSARADHPDIANGAYVILRVTDTGEGIAEEDKDRLFEPFFTTKPEGKGTGLGLPSVHGILEQSGGHIRLRSERGQGASFTVYLPVTDALCVQSPTPVSA